MTVEQLTHDALALPEQDRAALAQTLLHSLDRNGNDEMSEEIEREWVNEVLRRREAIRNDPSRLIPWEIAREQLRTELAERRKR